MSDQKQEKRPSCNPNYQPPELRARREKAIHQVMFGARAEDCWRGAYASRRALLHAVRWRRVKP